MEKLSVLFSALLLASAGALLAPASTRRVSTVRFAGDAERVELTLTGATVQSVFWANQCRREMVTFLGIAGTVDSDGAAVKVVAEGSRKKLDRFVRWCARGPTDQALEGGKPQFVGDVVYGAATGLAGFACSEDLCDVDLEPPADPVAEAMKVADADDDDFDESELIANLIEELSA